MAFDRFLIAPVRTGLQLDMKPWLIMDDAFITLQNVYPFRDRIRKRFGSVLMQPSPLLSRLRVSIGTTNGSGNLTVTMVPGIIYEIGQLFSVGSEILTVIALGTPGVLLTTGSSSTHTFDTTSGEFIIAGGPINTTVYYYPALPVMGITQYESGAVNNHPTFAFDTEFAYFWTGNGWDFTVPTDYPVWQGDDLNFFWTCNWQGTDTLAADGIPVLFVSNFQVTNYNGAGTATDDPLWAYTETGPTWTSINGANGFYFLPTGLAPQSGPFVQTAKIVLPFKDRLLLLNTVENDNSGGYGVNTNYVNRCRYSFNGTPFAVNSWYEGSTMDTSGNVGAGAGYIDAPTEEQIITAEFIKDRLIVYFERSTWELAYTANEILPFVWQKLNTELGSQSTFSTVPFDKVVLTVGNTGIHACNGSNVERIDNKIPDIIFDSFRTGNNETLRTAGIRDYYTEMVYWAYLNNDRWSFQNYPNTILVYNYKEGSWAQNDDCFTAFGYFEQQTDLTWQSAGSITWEQFVGTWDSGVFQANQRQILGGTPEGFMLIIAPDISRNAASMQITNMSFAATGLVTLTIINHNFGPNDYILIENVQGNTATQNALNGNIFPLEDIIETDSNTIVIDTNGVLTNANGSYTGAGTGARVSNIQITTKQFNPYVTKDRNIYIQRVDFGVTRTFAGEITVDYYPSYTSLSMIDQGEKSGSIMGNGVLETSAYDPTYYPLETDADQLWHPVYFQTDGQSIQLALYFTNEQMVNPEVSLVNFELHGMVLYTQPTVSRLS